MNVLRHLPPLVALALILGVAGCESAPSALDPAWRGPFFTPANVARDDRLPADMRRVVLLPVCVGALAPVETATALDAALFAALQRQQRFEVVALTRAECRRLFGAEEFSSTAALPHGFLDKIARTCAADGIVFTDLTVFRAYRPLALGLRAKLATAAEVRLVWSFDELFPADDPAVANSARHYCLQGDRPAPFDLSTTALQSPARFAAYAADAMFATLPPR